MLSSAFFYAINIIYAIFQETASCLFVTKSLYIPSSFISDSCVPCCAIRPALFAIICQAYFLFSVLQYFSRYYLLYLSRKYAADRKIDKDYSQDHCSV